MIVLLRHPDRDAECSTDSPELIAAKLAEGYEVVDE